MGNVLTNRSVLDPPNVGAPMFVGEPVGPGQTFDYAAKRPRMLEWQIPFDFQAPRRPRDARVINRDVCEFEPIGMPPRVNVDDRIVVVRHVLQAKSLLTMLGRLQRVVSQAVHYLNSHSSDWEGVELALSSTNAVEHLSLPYDPASRRLFGVPIVATVSEAAGVGHVLATEAVLVDTDTIGVGVQWSETSNTDDFAKNLIRARCEGRFGTSVLSPMGVVTCDLTP